MASEGFLAFHLPTNLDVSDFDGTFGKIRCGGGDDDDDDGGDDDDDGDEDGDGGDGNGLRTQMNHVTIVVFKRRGGSKILTNRPWLRTRSKSLGEVMKWYADLLSGTPIS